MRFDDEKDYLMRMIKEIIRVLMSLLLGKNYVQVELPPENNYTVSGQKLDSIIEMADNGQINEAENLLLSNLNYTDKDEVIAAAYFYQHLSGKNREFLSSHDYSMEEVADGLKQLAKRAGYKEVLDMLE